MVMARCPEHSVSVRKDGDGEDVVEVVVQLPGITSASQVTFTARVSGTIVSCLVLHRVSGTILSCLVLHRVPTTIPFHLELFKTERYVNYGNTLDLMEDQASVFLSTHPQTQQEYQGIGYWNGINL
jgi:hypothetical protein